MEFYNTYRIATLISSFFANDWAQLFSYSFAVGFVILSVLFVLQGIGLFTMAKKRNLKNKWLAFIPFVNVWYMDKLAGECRMFGHKVKRIGVYAMVAQICVTIVTVATIAAEVYLYVNHGAPVDREYYWDKPYWSQLTGFSKTVENFYIYSDFFLSIFQLISRVLLLILLTALFRKYTIKHHMPLSLLAFMFPLSRFIIIFCICRNKEEDYDAYMRKRQEEFIRRQSQYRRMYGNPHNPYANPYGRGYGPYQNPYGDPYYNHNNHNDFNNSQARPPQDEPFSEFFSENKEKNASSSASDSQENKSNSSSEFDDFFS